MGLGTALVLVFSDPMVDALSEWGTRLGISSFYVSFVLAPFASNASELLSAYTYAVKRTEKSLAWQFTAETIAMVLIQWVIGMLAITSKTHTFKTGCLILACYPGCLLVVWVLENLLGLD